MAVLDQINSDLATSMKEGVASRTTVLRLLKSSVKNEEIKLGHELTEPEVVKVLQREAKQRRDSITQYQNGGRKDLADSEAHELEIIEAYLPQQLSDTELVDIVNAAIVDTGAESPSQMGVVIGAVMQQVAGRADGGRVAQLVRQKLAA